MSKPRLGFIMEKISVPLEALVPVRQFKDPKREIRRYQAILSSIKEVGLVEPLIVYPKKGTSGMYLLMDGHLRYHALKELGRKEADCVVSTEDESFTYNARVARLSPIQEHKMITKAVKSGVSAEKIAAALNLEVHYVKNTLTLLKGIDEEAVDLLKDKEIFRGALYIFKRVSAQRQIEMAELMVSANDFSKGYAEALLIGTPKDQLRDTTKPKIKSSLSAEDIARMEAEMGALEQDFKAVEEGYGEDMLNLTLARGYIKRLLENAKVVRFLSSRYQDIFSEFEIIASTELL